MQSSNPPVQKDLLQGIHVIDCSQFIPGPYATLLCADLGATVVKVEPPGGDPMRYLGALDTDGVTPAYKLINSNKTVIEIDLKSPDGKNAFRDLLKHADVLLESYRPDVFARLGFGATELKAINPALIHIAVTGYGQTGAYRLRAGHDLNYVAMAGLLAISGTPNLPVQSTPPTADFGGALQAAFTMLAALLYRQRTGKGLSIDVSLSEAVMAWQSLYLTESARTDGGIKRGSSFLNGGLACYQIYKTKDGAFVTLAALEPKFWANFCQAVAHSQWIPRQFEAMPQTTLTNEVAELFATKNLRDWSELLAPVDCCFERVLELSNLVSSEHIKDRQIIHQARDQSNQPLLEVLFPAWIEGQPPAKRNPIRFASAPEVLAEWRAKRENQE